MVQIIDNLHHYSRSNIRGQIFAVKAISIDLIAAGSLSDIHDRSIGCERSDVAARYLREVFNLEGRVDRGAASSGTGQEVAGCRGASFIILQCQAQGRFCPRVC